MRSCSHARVRVFADGFGAYLSLISKWHRVAHAQGLCRRWSVHFLSFFLYVRTVRIYQSREVQANKARSEAQDTCVHDNG